MKPQQLFIFTICVIIAIAVGLGAAALADTLRPDPDWQSAALQTAATPAEAQLQKTETAFTAFATQASAFDSSVKDALAADKQISYQLAALADKASSNKNLSDEAYEKMIVSRLGDPIYTNSGNNSSLMIFKLIKEDFRGYMAKIKLKTSKALRVTINPESAPTGETTSQAAKRTGAIFAVNGGGFASATADGETVLVPLGNTMIKGQLIGGFQPSEKNLAFAGFTKDNVLTGGKYYNKADLLATGAYQGVSFVPALIDDWEPLTIPAKWAGARQPRTVLGQYPNGDIFFIVVDGRQSNWSSGITLEEMQILLLRLGVMEAYNLDGGGSTAMYYNGQILNKPSDGSQRKLATNLVVFK